MEFLQHAYSWYQLTNKKTLFAILSILFLVIFIPLILSVSKKQQDIRQRASGTGIEYGINIDIQTASKTPNATEFLALNPAWIRYVYRPNSNTRQPFKQLVVFNHESASSFPPFENDDIQAWKNYFDLYYLPSLATFLTSTNITTFTSAIEIWNEEDMCTPRVYCPRVPEQAYAYLIKNAARLIKSQNPNMQVVMGGLASGQTNYITNVKNADPTALSQVDAVGIHPYGKSPDGWSTNILQTGDLATMINNYKTTANPTPIWITEIGFGTNDKAWQAEYLTRSFNLLSSLQIPVAIWYSWIDTMTGADGGSNWGLYDASNTIKPSGNAFASLTNTTPTQSIPTPTGSSSTTVTPIPTNPNCANGPSINGVVYSDLNNNAHFDQTQDQGLSGWTLNLRNAQRAIIATATSNQNGLYTFDHLTPGTYIVSEIPQAGWNRIQPNSSQNFEYTLIIPQEGCGFSYVDFGNVSTSVTSIPTIPPTATPTVVVPTALPATTCPPIVTPIPIPSQTVFELNLELTGIGTANSFPIRCQRVVSLQLYNGANQKIGDDITGVIMYDTSSRIFRGWVPLLNQPTVPYSVSVKTDRYLKKTIPGFQNPSTNTRIILPTTTLTVGNTNNDDKIDASDFNIIRDCFGKTAADAGCVNADLDDNGVIDGVDINLFIKYMAVRPED